MLIDEEKAERIKVLPEPHRSKMVTLYKASMANWNLCQTDHSAAALKNAQFADAALDAYWQKVCNEGGAAEPHASERFSSRKMALDWLGQQGMKISRGKFYEDCKAGLVLVYPDKSVSKASVAQYLINSQRGTPLFDAAAADMSVQEQLLRMRKLELEVAKLERQDRVDDAKWVLREDSWAQLVGVLHMLRQNIEYYLHQSAAKLVLAVEGQADLAPQLVDLIPLEVVNPAFNDLGGQTLERACFYGIKEGEDEDDKA